MQLQIEAPHFEPDEELVNLVCSKFEHPGKRYDRIILRCDIEKRK